MRFSLSNKFFNVSHTQFVDHCENFKAAVEQHFLTPCAIDINGYSEPKEYITFLDDDMQKSCDMVNASNALFKGMDLGQVSRELWKQARHVEATIRPINEGDAPRSAFAHVEFKGHLPGAATFYVQPDDQARVRTIMRRHNPTLLLGNGYDSHGNSNGIMHGAGASFFPRFSLDN